MTRNEIIWNSVHDVLPPEGKTVLARVLLIWSDADDDIDENAVKYFEAVVKKDSAYPADSITSEKSVWELDISPFTVDEIHVDKFCVTHWCHIPYLTVSEGFSTFPLSNFKKVNYLD